jgi:hypothetical protein
MGGAKRRRKAGSPPLHYLQGGLVEDFRVPDGKLALTIELMDHAPVTIGIDADQIADILAEMTAMLGDTKLDYHDLVQGFAKEFIKRRTDGGAVFGILWTALYHPKGGEKFREMVSRQIANKGKAHITYRLSPKGLAIALAYQCADVDEELNTASQLGVQIMAVDDDDDRTPSH